ncbi:MAG: hypothetical protein HY900_08205 [Deltaproteobacteria bacterium]|nr:hypothetical protein [Deltaproteobacteria bacterium]
MLCTIHWNVGFGMAFKAGSVLESGAGLPSPFAGAVVHNIGSVLVVLSSARLALGWDRRPSAAPPAPDREADGDTPDQEAATSAADRAA